MNADTVSQLCCVLCVVVGGLRQRLTAAPGAGHPGSLLLMSWKQAGCCEQQRDKHSHHRLHWEAADHCQLLIQACTHLGTSQLQSPFCRGPGCLLNMTRVKEISNALYMQSWGLVNDEVYSLSQISDGHPQWFIQSWGQADGEFVFIY